MFSIQEKLTLSLKKDEETVQYEMFSRRARRIGVKNRK